MTDKQALTIDVRQLATQLELDAANAIYADDDVQIDTHAFVYRADDAVWVRAWVRVPNEMLKTESRG